MMEQIIEKLEELKDYTLQVLCDSQGACFTDCDECLLKGDMEKIKEEFENIKLLLEEMDM